MQFKLTKRTATAAADDEKDLDLLAGNAQREPRGVAPEGGQQHGTSAALEFGVRALKVRHIVVLGHAFCGGIKAFASDDAPLTASDFIGRWMSQIAPAADAIEAPKEDRESYLRQLEFASVGLSLKNLMTFPFVKAAVEQGELHLHGAYFGVAEGSLSVLDQAAKEFRSVREAQASS